MSKEAHLLLTLRMGMPVMPSAYSALCPHVESYSRKGSMTERAVYDEHERELTP